MLHGVTQEGDGRRREVVLYTDEQGRQSIRMRYRTKEEEEKAQRERLTGVGGQRPGAAVWNSEGQPVTGRTQGPLNERAQERKDKAE